MATAAENQQGSHKRKEGDAVSEQTRPSKKTRSLETSNQQPSSLLKPHESIISELHPKYEVLPLSIISSTQIRKRVTFALQQLLPAATSGKAPVPMFHARTSEVCKMITIVELLKRELAGRGQKWFQYNEMFELPVVQQRDVVEETVLEPRGRDSEGEEEDDDFEVMQDRFEKAVMPPPPGRKVMSMRIFVSVVAIPELRSRDGVTVQGLDKEGK